MNKNWHVDILLAEVEKKIAIGHIKNWTNSKYQKLSDEILKETNE